MQAVRIHQFGDVGVLRPEEVADPQPGSGQVRVAVRAASVNRGDLARRMGSYPGEVKFPLTLGWEVAGEIDALGEGVDRRRLGQRVVAIANSGGYAERLVTVDAAAVALPDRMEFDVAASVPVVFLSAWQALVEIAKVQEGECVLVHAAASGVGMAGLQIAVRHGARVLATAGSPSKLEFARRLGAAAAINYTDQDFVEEVWRLTGGRGVDVVLESVGGETFEASVEVLREHGRLVTVGNTVAKTASIDPAVLIRNNLSLHGLYVGRWVLSGRAWPALAEILQLVASGAFQVAIDRRFALHEAAAAHQYLEQRRNLGKVVLMP